VKVLITGIHGFVGSNLVSAFKEFHTLYGLDIVSPQKEGVLHTFSWDEIERIPQVDLVLHLAGKAHDMKSQTDAQCFFDINTRLTQRIFDWFLISEAKKFIFFSSVKAVADCLNGLVLTEDFVPDPKGPYGKSKLEAEKYINQHLQSNKVVYILRPCMIHGRGNKGNLNLLIKLQQTGFPWPLGAYNNKRSFTSMGNLIFILEQLFLKDIETGIYNVADDEPISTNDIICLISNSLNKNIKIWNIAPNLIHFFAKIGDKLKLPLNSDRLTKLTESYVVSNMKMKNALGISKMPLTVEEGLLQTIESFKDEI